MAVVREWTRQMAGNLTKAREHRTIYLEDRPPWRWGAYKSIGYDRAPEKIKLSPHPWLMLLPLAFWRSGGLK